MRQISLVLILCFGLGLGGAQAQDRDIQSVIDRQMQAFLAGDVETAFGFASPTLRRLFGTSQNFGMMVQQGYPMVWNPARFAFLEQREIGGVLWQKVQVVDQRGDFHLLDYQMISVDGVWRINGVQYTAAPPANV